MAGRYATALFELAREQNGIDRVKVDLDRFEALVDEVADLARLLRSPVFSAEEQTRALSGVLDRAGIDGLAANVLKLLGTNRRLFAALDVARGYRALVAKHKGEVTAEVTLRVFVQGDVADFLGAVRAERARSFGDLLDTSLSLGT